MDSEPKKDTNFPKKTYQSLGEFYYGDSPALIHVFNKTEKITLAVYLISDVFFEQEPLKWKLRNLGLNLISGLSSVSGSFSSHTLFNLYVELSALFRLALRSRLVSEMNYNVLNKEIEGVMSLLVQYNSQQNINEEIFNRNDGIVLDEISQEFTKKDTLDTVGKGQSKGQYRTSFIAPHGRKTEAKSTPSEDEDNGSSTSERREIILGVLKNKEWISINDVSLLISGCSEKTIQRELLSMVEAGILVKEGERRWSKYKLAQKGHI